MIICLGAQVYNSQKQPFVTTTGQTEGSVWILTVTATSIGLHRHAGVSSQIPWCVLPAVSRTARVAVPTSETPPVCSSRRSNATSNTYSCRSNADAPARLKTDRDTDHRRRWPATHTPFLAATEQATTTDLGDGHVVRTIVAICVLPRPCRFTRLGPSVSCDRVAFLEPASGPLALSPLGSLDLEVLHGLLHRLGLGVPVRQQRGLQNEVLCESSKDPRQSLTAFRRTWPKHHADAIV